jgi:hypothetical protein
MVPVCRVRESWSGARVLLAKGYVWLGGRIRKGLLLSHLVDSTKFAWGPENDPREYFGLESEVARSAFVGAPVPDLSFLLKPLSIWLGVTSSMLSG